MWEINWTVDVAATLSSRHVVHLRAGASMLGGSVSGKTFSSVIKRGRVNMESPTHFAVKPVVLVHLWYLAALSDGHMFQPLSHRSTRLLAS